MYSSDNLNYKGVLTNYIKETRNIGTPKSQCAEYEEYQYFFKKMKLNEKQVANVVQHILITELLDISLDTSKSEWETHFLDCGSICIQSNINGTYRNITFECPWGQKDTVTWKKPVMENYHFLKTEFQLDSLNNVFKLKLPKGNPYMYDGPDIMIISAKKQSKQWQKETPYREYFLSIEDTLHNYLETEIEKQKILLNEMICLEDYYFLFKKGGTFKKVKIGKYKRKYQIEEKQEILQCKKKMKEIFSQINLGWMNLKYDIVFSCSFNREGKVKFGKFY